MVENNYEQLLTRYTWLRDMVAYVNRINGEQHELENKLYLTEQDKKKLVSLTNETEILNPAIEYFIYAGLYDPRFLCLYVYYQYKQIVRLKNDQRIYRLFERIKKDYFKDMKEFMAENSN